MRTADGVFVVDLETEDVLDLDAEVPPAEPPHVELPRVVAAAAAGSTVVAVVDRRPPLAVSHDAGRFWRALAPELPEIEAVAFVA